jgi:hypothetical protein
VLSLLPTTASETNQCSGGRLLEQLVWQTEMTSVDTHGCLREARRCYLRWDLLGLLRQRQAEQRPGLLLADGMRKSDRYKKQTAGSLDFRCRASRACEQSEAIQWERIKDWIASSLCSPQ